MKVLITGGLGQVGSDCTQALATDFQVISLGKTHLDLGRPDSVRVVLNEHRPDFVVNAAAFTNVDACETDRDKALLINAAGPAFLAEWCEERNIPLLHLSTDYVFDGRKAPPAAYLEADAPEPVNHYGLSKWEGEKRVAETAKRFAIVRTAWVYGRTGHNFLKSILKAALRDGMVRVVDDQWGSPTWSYRLALQIRRLIQSDTQGLYHATAEGFANWYEVARYFLESMGIDAEVSPCSSADYPRAAQRPQNSILENGRLKESGLNMMVDWREDMAEFVARFRNGLIREAEAA